MSFTINPATSQSAYQSYFANAASVGSGVTNNGTNGGGNVSPVDDWQGKHGKSDFMQNLLQALQQLAVSLEGLTSPSTNANANPATPSSGAAANSQGVSGEEISITFTSSTIIDTASASGAGAAYGSNANASAASFTSSSLEIDTSMTITLATTDATSSGGVPVNQGGGDQGSSTSPNTDIRQLFHDFMHALFQALKQSGGQRQTSSGSSSTASGSGAAATGATTPAATSTATPVTPVAAGYGGDFGNNLTNLINALSLDNNASGSPNPADSNLQTAFNNLISALQGNSGSAPSLVDLLKQVQNNNSGSTVNPTGNAVSVSA